MKRIVLFICCAFTLFHFVSAQNEGIRFEKPEWKQVVRKASKEKKLIFVDCYTSWCGPCKELAKNIFPQKVVGDFYNRHFVSTKVDMDKDAMAAVRKKSYSGCLSDSSFY
ncbi:MAG: thioredoxin domain-containing protein [Odoribacter splanchnicus]